MSGSGEVRTAARHGPEPSEAIAPWLAEIIVNAGTLAERLKWAASEGGDVATSDRCVDPRWERWRRMVAVNGGDAITERLHWLETDETAARRALASAAPAGEGAAKPGWAEWIERFVAEGKSVPTEAIQFPDTSTAAESVPFADFFQPVLRVARRALSAELGTLPGWDEWAEAQVAPAVWEAAERFLVSELAELSWRVLFEKFSRVRPIGAVMVREMSTRSDDRPGAEHYRGFIGKLWQDGGVGWFQEYPVLARMMAVRAEFWVASQAELMRRVKRDWADLLAAFGPPGARNARLTGLTEGISDRHENGRSVAILEFGGGFKCVYKPKDLKLATRYHRLLDWCNRAGAGHATFLPFRGSSVVEREGYGWCEFIAAGDCADRAAVERFHRRAGQLLCLTHLLGGVDFHFNNLIAAGEHPVLIDLESLLHPLFSAEMASAPRSVHAIDHRFAVSVMHTSLLPSWRLDVEAKTAFDNSGLGSVGCGEHRGGSGKWRDLNTDAMRPDDTPGGQPPRKNLPVCGNETVHAGDMREPCLAGYRAMHALLEENAAALLASETWADFRGQPVRFLFRNTLVYGALWQKTLEPGFLRFGVDRSLQFELLARGLFVLRDGERFRPLVEREIRALEQGDIPLFHTDSASARIVCNGEAIVASTGYPPPFDEATRRLRNLGRADRDWQCEIIHGALCARVMGEGARKPIDAPERVAPTGSLSPEEALAEACRIGDELVKRSWSADGNARTWLGFSQFHSGRRQFGPLGAGLYEGVCGPALFLASLSRVTGEAVYRKTALQALVVVLDWLEMENGFRTRWSRSLGNGGLQGVGSIVYALAKIGSLLDEERLIAAAEAAADLITVEALREEVRLEVMQGSAGALLGLLALHAVSRDRKIGGKIEAGAMHLMERRAPAGEAPAGFAHGMAGICHALIEAGRALGQESFGEKGLNGFREVARLLAGGEGDDRERPPGSGARALGLRANWCQGVGGIALPMVSILRETRDAGLSGALELALERAGQAGLRPLDHLCCGNFGLVELFATVGRDLGRPVEFERAGALARSVLERRDRSGRFRLFEEVAGPVFHPGFFQGLAGIGHGLLRLHTGTIPSPALMK